MAENSPKFKETKLKGVRKTIAEHMIKSSRENAVIMMSRKTDVTELIEYRKAKKKEQTGENINFPSVNDLVLKATALALKEHPNINSTFENEIIKTYEDININMAVAVPDGLITPVIKNADKLSLSEIAETSKKMSEKVKKGMFTMEDIMGGTFTVTNVGMLKVEVATSIINYPQVGILAVGTVVPSLERIDGSIKDTLKMYLSLTVDHRIIDGYPAALFLNTICEKLENSKELWD
jgi:pyruvate dehydrogenase E2 component (dihydrolipoamide acetyltransferase)